MASLAMAFLAGISAQKGGRAASAVFALYSSTYSRRILNSRIGHTAAVIVALVTC